MGKSLRLAGVVMLGACASYGACTPFAGASGTDAVPEADAKATELSDAEARSDAGALFDWAVFAQNGHRYLLVVRPEGITWSAARDEAKTLGGHLATIASRDENEFVWNLVKDVDAAFHSYDGNNLGPWLGGLQPTSSAQPGVGWSWVTDEEWSYVNWSPGEPNDSGGAEDHLHFYSWGARRPEWSDGPDTTRIRGYIVESEE